jgi:hypothetical protein
MSNTPPLKTFVYVSDTKVDMLYEQLAEAHRRQLTHELSINAKPVSYTITASPQLRGSPVSVQ